MASDETDPKVLQILQVGYQMGARVSYQYLIDEIDLKILKILQADGKTSHTAIAEKVGIKAPSVFERIKKLEAKGVIQGYTALINAEALGKNLTAFIGLTLLDGPAYADENLIVEELAREPEIEECHVIAGEESLLLKVRVRTPQEFQDLTMRLRHIGGVARTRTTIALTTSFDRPGPSIE
jgi:Lrp/AsnC family leucine-responsive transcriptional regulator